jgi:crossover junction endodeoxyribonuclease RuvC
VDPGSLHTGYGVIDFQGERARHLASGRFSPKAQAFPERLRFIFEGLSSVMAELRPSAMALESVFTHKNPRSALLLAQARGVAVLVAALHGAEVFEYQPQQVKNAVCGYGLADKGRVAEMAMRLLGLSEGMPKDASDALAVAICHAGLHRPLGLGAAKPPKAKSPSWRSLSPADLRAMGLRFEE